MATDLSLLKVVLEILHSRVSVLSGKESSTLEKQLFVRDTMEISFQYID